MRYHVSLDPTATTPPTLVDVKELPTGQLEVSIGGTRVDVDVVWIDGVASIRVGGRIVDLVTEGQPPELGAVVSGHRTYVRVESDRQKAAAAATGGGARGNEKVVKSPMPGRVVRLLVAKGAAVEAGTTLCVVEAMKMENELKSPKAGVVSDLFAVEGAAVENGAKLVIVT